ncbi:TPA: efflux RND transporter periplasmic adaptor subunit [Enterobacter hormaechei subsp. steigerwaltii]|nr:efflux RND transporter periplasmic adaptor subunit [Enterobacter hormaechei subsp. steigerwaltii]
MKIRLTLLCLSLMVSACDSQEKSKDKQKDDLSVEVITLQSQPVTISMSLPGRTTAIRTAEVRPQVSGIILKRLFKEGSEVKAGDQLYQIDASTYEASLEKANAQKVNAEFVLNRYRTLIKSNAVSKQTYDEAVSDYAQAKADLKTAQVNLDYTRVRAPISGRISRSSVTEGALVTDGQSDALATITQTDPINVDVSQSSSDLLKLRRALARGQLKAVSPHEAAVQLTLEDGTAYNHEGKLEFSEVNVDEGTGTVTLRAQFPNPDNVLLPGMFVHSTILQGVEQEGILVPQSAIMRNNKGTPYVFVVDDKKQAKQQLVSTGQMTNGQWQITDGLKAGQQVIVSNLQSLSTGVKVEASEYKKPEQKNSDSTISLSMTDPSAQ